MIFELVLLAGGCHSGACRLERPLIERRVVKSVLVQVEKQVTRERTVRRITKRR